MNDFLYGIDWVVRGVRSRDSIANCLFELPTGKGVIFWR